MSEAERRGWLEVVGDAGESHTVYCPRKEKDMPLRECLGCNRYASLALDPSGKHVYLDCDWAGAEEVRRGEGEGEAAAEAKAEAEAK